MISLKFVPMVRINNIPALVPTRWQAIIWTNDGYITNAYMHHLTSMKYYVGMYFCFVARQQADSAWMKVFIICS